AKGYTVREVETLFESRLLGESFMSRFPLRVVARALVDLAKGFVEFRLLQKRESLLAEFLRTHPPAREDPPLRGWRALLLRVFLATMPLHKWMITRRAGLYYAELERSQWLAPAQLRELQERKLRRLVHHAYHHVGYYREAMDARQLKPADIATLEDLRKLPLLDKAQVRESLYFDLLSDNHDKRRILKVTTSGSTGEPFVCYADQHQLEIRWAATLRSLEWTGWRFGDRQARLWHQTIGMSWHQVLRERLDAWLSRRIFIPAFEMSEKDVDRAVLRLRRFRPVLIDGYAECFNFLAEYARRHPAPGISPRGIVSSAQVLPEDSRAAIEEAFRTRVFDKYGSREFSGLAYECEAHQGHHVVGESYLVE
ncbi:MAG: phenylacetate--CoA ligase family protein, partial [Burkholderiales bacterium]